MIDESWYVNPGNLPEADAAGGVVARVEDGRVVLALAMERFYDDCVLPKGHVEPGEDIEEAARREIAEEVGVEDLKLLCKLGEKSRMDFRKTEWKTTHYYLFATDQVDASPLHTEQHDDMVWVPLDPLPKLFWPEQRAVIEENRDLIAAKMLGEGR